MRARILALGAILAFVPPVFAEVPADWPPAIEDNSFLIEEAYNQEPGVVQYIVNAWFVRPANGWLLAFTNEWPVPGQTHQLSYTVPYAVSTEDGSGIGDVFLNYRYQATSQENSAVAFAPRISAIVPVGDWERGLGQGAYGVGFNLPVSRRFSRSWVGHFNLGGSWRDGAKTLLDDGSVARDDLVSLFGGASAVWLASARVNAMLELFAYRDDERVNATTLERRFRAVLNPGVRYAIDTSKGQLVLGAAVPFGLNPESPDPGLFLYLSWEAPHWTD